MPNPISQDITSANATCVLVIEEVVPAGVPVDNFSTDQAINGETMEVAETRLTLDGQLLAGYVPSQVPVNLTLEPTSLAYRFIEQAFQVSRLQRKTLRCSLVFMLPAIGKGVGYKSGVIQALNMIPPVGRTLQSRQVRMVFSSENIYTI